MNSRTLRNIVLVGLFIIPFCQLFVFDSLFFPFITSKAFAFRILVEIIFGSWIILALLEPEYRPKRSPVLITVVAFLAVIGIANLLGENPIKSFWSNFERMEGFIAMLHFGAFFLVISSVLKSREWVWWWNTVLSTSVVFILYGLFQRLGAVAVMGGGTRPDGNLGNPSYYALYLLVHIFLVIFMIARTKSKEVRWLYLALLFGQLMMLYFAAARAGILGLIGGVFIIALFNITNAENKSIQKWSRAVVIGLVLLVGGFVAIRDTAFVQNSLILNRFADINLSSLRAEGRYFIWPIAWEGIKERPILGWGQDNFNYVFAEHYSPKMFNLEPWFDRAHNIFLDWGVAGGFLGLASYVALYVVLLTSVWRGGAFSRVEASVLTGLLAAYSFNNFFVFDNLTSYIFFFALLGYTHTRITPEEIPGKVGMNEKKTLSFSVLVAVFVCGSIYFVNIKPIVTNLNLIRGLQISQNEMMVKEPAMMHFQKAYNSSRLGRPEVVEWLTIATPNILSDNNISLERRNEFFAFAREAVITQANDFPGDPRYEMIAGTLLAQTGHFDEALVHLNEAHRLMPNKQTILFYMGQTLYSKGDNAGALKVFKEAYDLAPEYTQARMLYEEALKQIGS